MITSGQRLQPFPHLPMRITGTNSITGKGVEMKKCSKCLELKSATEFTKMPSSKDGLYPSCKPCRSKQRKESYSANPYKFKVLYAAWRAANLDKEKALNSAYRAANKDKVSASKAKYYAANKGKSNARMAAWRKTNPDKVRALNLNRKAMKRNAEGRHTAADIHNLMTLQKSKCACCRVSIKGGYHVDHIMPLAKNGSNDRLNLQLLCPSCNLQKNAKHPIDFMQSRGFLL